VLRESDAIEDAEDPGDIWTPKTLRTRHELAFLGWRRGTCLLIISPGLRHALT